MINWAQISWFTHSSPQFFNPSQWGNFKKIHKKNRAKVALALEFDAVVLAVLSLDLLVQVSTQWLHTTPLMLWSYSIASVPLGNSWDFWNPEQCYCQFWQIRGESVSMDSSQDPSTNRWPNPGRQWLWSPQSQLARLCNHCHPCMGWCVLWLWGLQCLGGIFQGRLVALLLFWLLAGLSEGFRAFSIPYCHWSFCQPFSNWTAAVGNATVC